MLRIGSKLIVKNVYEEKNPLLVIAGVIEQSIMSGQLISFNPTSYNESSRRNYVYALKKKHNLALSVEELVAMPREEFQKLVPKKRFRRARYDLTVEEKIERCKFDDIKKLYEEVVEIEEEEDEELDEKERLYKMIFDGLEEYNLDFIARNRMSIRIMKTVSI